MSGLVTYYRVPVSDNTKLYQSIEISTSRYDNTRIYLKLTPNNTNIEINRVFANTVLTDLGAQVNLGHMRFDTMNRPLHPPVLATRDVTVAGTQARNAADRLFQHREINADERSAIEDPLRELERCLDYISRLSMDISPAQRSIIESFVGPYFEILRDLMEPWLIKAALQSASIIVVGFVNPEGAFRSDMLSGWSIRTETNPSQPIINQEWSSETQGEVLDALYMIAKVITGKANLEGALLQSGPNLPNLQTQERVVMDLFAFPE
jgi:hypothetical protein